MTDDVTTELEKIAYEELYIPTLERRDSDDLDFHEVAVWAVRRALEQAYAAGVASVKTSELVQNKAEGSLSFSDPIELLSDEDRTKLYEDLQELARLRQEAAFNLRNVRIG